MTHDVKLTFCFASSLMLSSMLWAENISPGDPYATIALRNIFNLTPPPPPVIPPVAAAPPPKIIANGIMTIFGSKQALFKVASTGQPGQPARDPAYILSEGQRQDDIEITHIDEPAGMITFNNHGVIQYISLTNAPALSASDPSPAMTEVGSAGRRFRNAGLAVNNAGH